MWFSFNPKTTYNKITSSYLFFFLCVVNDSWPLSSALSSDWLLLLVLEELLEEPLEESLATPVSSFTSIVSANAANSGSLSLSTFNHLRDNFGLPRTYSKIIKTYVYYYTACILFYCEFIVLYINSYCFMPHYWKIRTGTEILSNCYSFIKI